jgi:hypothetical protein
MSDYSKELNELKVLFNNLGNYSSANVHMLQIILERYDGVVEQLFIINSKVFLSSAEIITEAIDDMGLIVSDEMPISKKKMLFEKNKFKLKVAINNDISKYGHYKMIEHIIYN